MEGSKLTLFRTFPVNTNIKTVIKVAAAEKLKSKMAGENLIPSSFALNNALLLSASYQKGTAPCEKCGWCFRLLSFSRCVPPPHPRARLTKLSWVGQQERRSVLRVQVAAASP